MTNEELKNSPLHGLSTETMLTELVNFYGWEVLDAAIDLKCLRIRPTIPSCLTFLKKAEWARNRVEEFYLYSFKQMPKPSDAELEMKPRERGFPNGVVPKKPLVLTVQTARGEQPRRDYPRGDNPRGERVRGGNPRGERVRREKPMVDEEPTQSRFRSRFSRPQD